MKINILVTSGRNSKQITEIMEVQVEDTLKDNLDLNIVSTSTIEESLPIIDKVDAVFVTDLGRETTINWESFKKVIEDLKGTNKPVFLYTKSDIDEDKFKSDNVYINSYKDEGVLYVSQLSKDLRTLLTAINM